jgi:hypothetical protein
MKMNQPQAQMPQVAQAESADSKQPTLQDVEKKYFSSDAIEAGGAYVNQVVELAQASNIQPLLNFNPDEAIPDGFGLAVIPLNKRVPERGNVINGICIAAIPELTTVAEADNGQDWINKLVTDALIRQVANAAKPKEEGALTSLPLSVAEFITSARSSGLAAFNEFASAYVTALKKKGLKFMSKVLLRQTLQSAAVAGQIFPKISQDDWKLVLQSMIQHAQKASIDSGVLKLWLETRDQAEISTAELDLSDIDGMLDT